MRANDIQHPGAAVVRYVFQNHMRGSMWSVFTPKRFEPGARVITAADLGYERLSASLAPERPLVVRDRHAVRRDQVASSVNSGPPPGTAQTAGPG